MINCLESNSNLVLPVMKFFLITLLSHHFHNWWMIAHCEIFATENYRNYIFAASQAWESIDKFVESFGYTHGGPATLFSYQIFFIISLSKLHARPWKPYP